MTTSIEALSALFAVVDDVFTEPDAFAADKLNVGLGRIYREWLNARSVLDPDFDREEYRERMKARR